MSNSAQKRHRTKDNTLRKSQIVSLLLLCSIVLTLFGGCSKDGYTDLNKPGKEEPVLSQSSEESPPEQDLFEQKKHVFYDFLDSLKEAPGLQYQRTITPAEEITDTSSDLMRPAQATVFEKPPLTRIEYAEDSGLPFSMISTGTENYWGNTQQKIAAKVTPHQDDQKDNLLYLAKEASLTLISVGMEPLGDAYYLCFSVTEDSQMTNWYFTEDNQLFLRAYKEGESSIAVEYQDIKQVELEDSVFQLAGYELLDSLPENFLEWDATKEDSLEDKESSEEQSDTSTPEQEAKDSSQTSSPPPTPATTPPKTDPAPPASTPPATSTPTAPPAPPTTTPKSPVVTPPVPDNASGTAIEKIPETPKEPKKPTIPEQYPTESIPFPLFLTITDATVNNRTGVWSIVIEGEYSESSSTLISYYDELLEGTDRYKRQQTIDRDNNYTYTTINGIVDGWYVNATVSTSHFTNKSTLKLLVEK